MGGHSARLGGVPHRRTERGKPAKPQRSPSRAEARRRPARGARHRNGDSPGGSGSGSGRLSAPRPWAATSASCWSGGSSPARPPSTTSTRSERRCCPPTSTASPTKASTSTRTSSRPGGPLPWPSGRSSRPSSSTTAPTATPPPETSCWPAGHSPAASASTSPWMSPTDSNERPTAPAPANPTTSRLPLPITRACEVRPHQLREHCRTTEATTPGPASRRRELGARTGHRLVVARDEVVQVEWPDLGRAPRAE